MEYDKIKQLIEDMGNSKITSLDIEFPDGMKVKMEKGVSNVKVIETTTSVEEPIMKETVVKSEEIKEPKEDRKIIKSPMIGTFYAKPSPDSKPYVEVGTTVKKGTVLCIVEAMKLMNEIESEFDGKIVEILVKDGETVDYGKPLFKIV